MEMENVRIPKKKTKTREQLSPNTQIYTAFERLSSYMYVKSEWVGKDTACTHESKAGVSTLMSDKVDFRTRKITWAEEDTTYW